MKLKGCELFKISLEFPFTYNLVKMKMKSEALEYQKEKPLWKATN